MNNLTKPDSIHNGALNSHSYSTNSSILHYPSTSRTSPAIGMRTISPGAKYVIHPQQVQSQWQNLIMSSNNVATTINNQMYHAQQMQIQRQFFYHNGQPVTQINSQVNGFLPSTSTTNQLNGVNGTKKIAMKRKNSQQNLNDEVQRSVKKTGYIAVNGISSQNQIIYQHGNQTYCLQPAKFSPSSSTNNLQQQFSPFASYDHQDLINPTINYQQQQWNSSNAKQINSNSEIVRMELRNSVQARQNSPLHSSVIQQQNENNYRCNTTMNTMRINQQQIMPTNFTSINNNYNNNNLKLANGEHFDQHFFQQQQQIQHQQLQHQQQNQQRQQDHQKNFLTQRNISDENCPTILTYVDLDDFDLSELYDFNLLNDNNGFDLDNVETQKLVQMWLS